MKLARGTRDSLEPMQLDDAEHGSRLGQTPARFDSDLRNGAPSASGG